MTGPGAPAGVRRARDDAAAEERRRVVRRLLARPLLGQREEPETFATLVRHRSAVTAWFADHAGWQLVVDVSGGFARLHKTGATSDATRPATTARQARPFDRRRYALLCLTLAALDEHPGQTTLKHLADAVAERSAELAAVQTFDPARMTDRRAFVDALKLLGELGVLTERDGDVDRYATSGSGDALYDVDDRRLGQLVSAPSSPSLVERPEDLPVEAYPDTEEGRRLRARHRVVRRLLDEPAVYYDELDDAEADWLAHSLGFVRELCERDVGLTVERRAEGIVTVDEARELTDETFPDGGSTVKHAALLLAELLCARARAALAAREELPVLTDDDLTQLVTELLGTYGARCGWSVVYREAEGGGAHLARDAVALLARFNLVAPAGSGWTPRPAMARFAPAAPAAGAARATAGGARTVRASTTGATP